MKPLIHLDEELETFKKGDITIHISLWPQCFIWQHVNERDARKIKIKQKVRGCFRTDRGIDDFAKLYSIVEIAMKIGNSKFNAILAVVE